MNTLRFRCTCASLLILAAGVAAARAEVPLGNAFTYQGQLQDNSLPATGLYDFQFKLYDAAAGGLQRGATLTLAGVNVSRGQFNVTLDFGLQFAGGARWMEIAVAQSGGAYTILAPRQPLSPVPFALCASAVAPNGVTSAMLLGDANSLNKVSSGMMYCVPGSFVGVNRSSQITSDEIFGIGAVTGAGTFGGMYINASDPAGLPFYGYATNRTVKAYHYFDGGDGRWKLYAGGQRLTVDSATGNVGIGEGSPENTLHVKKGSAGTVTGNAEAPLIVENSGNAYLNFLTPSASESGVLFGLATDSASGGIIYNNPAGTKGLQFRTNGNYTRMTLDSIGNLGIGTSSPAHKVHILHGGTTDALFAVQLGTAPCAVFQMLNANTGSNALYATSNSLSSPAARIENTNGGQALYVTSNIVGAPAARIENSTGGPALQVDGNVGIGTSTPAVKLQINNTSDLTLAGGGSFVIGPTTGTNLAFDNNEIMVRNNGLAGTLYLNNDGGDVYIAPQATAHVRVLEVAGADVAEKFPVTDKVEPGMVVMIDADHPGQLCLARGAYNKRVAGVVSGANGLPAGTILGNLPGQDHAVPIALSGRVWVRCDAAARAIEIGDMLTTSTTPGHAMAAEDSRRAIGAVIGKAMTGLKAGQTGLVLVLVNLQ